MSGDELKGNTVPETITLTTRKAGKPGFTLLRTSVLALIVVIGLGIGWAAGGMLASALRNAIYSPESLNDNSELPNGSLGSESGLPETGADKPEPQTGEKKDVPLEEQIRQEALEEIHKKIEEANREFRKRGKRDKKGQRKKKGEDEGEEPDPTFSRKPHLLNPGDESAFISQSNSPPLLLKVRP